MPQSEGLRHVEAGEGEAGAYRDSACFMMSQDDSSRSVTEERVECTHCGLALNSGAQSNDGDGGSSERRVPVRSAKVPMTSDGALRLAIKLAVGEGDYERACSLLAVARTRPRR